MSTHPMETQSTFSDGRPSSPTPPSAPSTHSTPSHASTPNPEGGDLTKLLEWMQDLNEVQSASSPLGLGLGLATPDDEEDEDEPGITDASPKWRPFRLALEPSALVDGMEFGVGAVLPSTPFDADAATRAAVSAAADDFAGNHPSSDMLGTDLAPGEIFVEPRSAFYGGEEMQDQEYILVPRYDAPQPCVDPRTADITVDTWAFQPAPAPEPEPTPEPEPARAQTKKRKRGAESEPATKKTRVANGAGASGTSANVGGRKAPKPAPPPEPRNVQPIPETLKRAELFALLNISQIWYRDADGEQDVAPGVLYNAVAIRPSLWGNNGRLIKSKEDIRELYFSNCCGNTKSNYTETRHTNSATDHYPRLREHYLPKIAFKFFECTEEGCKMSRPRKDWFKRDHQKNSKCARRNEDPDHFKYLLENPATYATVHKHVHALRQNLIDKEIEALQDVTITHAVVARVMDNWDVVPDAICAVLINAGYHCFSEAEIKDRDLAFAGV